MKNGFSKGFAATAPDGEGGRATSEAGFAVITGGFAIWLGGGLGMAGGVTVMDTGPEESTEPV